MLKTSCISRDGAIANPNETLRVLEFQSNFLKDEQQNSVAQHGSKLFPKPGPLPEEKPQTLSELVSREDPTSLYRNMEKIGEGAAGEVFVAVSKNGKKVEYIYFL